MNVTHYPWRPEVPEGNEDPLKGMPVLWMYRSPGPVALIRFAGSYPTTTEDAERATEPV
jgi:hypothetical protein